MRSPEVPQSYRPSIGAIFHWSREKNREFFSITPENVKFCPKSAHFAGEQGSSRELAGNFWISHQTRINIEQLHHSDANRPRPGI
jgi:hypothetical protein